MSPLVVMQLVGLTVGFMAVEALATTSPNPVPQISAPLSPSSVLPGGAGFTLTVNGAGFVSGSVVNWNGSARASHFVSSTRLTVTILATDIAAPGTVSVTVFNPSPGGGTSNVADFHMTGPTTSLLLNRSDTTTGSAPRSVLTADVNGDGKLDMVVANYGADDIEVFLGNGDGTFQAATSYTTMAGPFALAAGDFNQDGKLDLAVAGDGSNMVCILLGNGNGTFQPALNHSAGLTPNSIAAADFNRDGKLDLVVTNFATNTVSVLLNSGGGAFQSPVAYSTGSGPISVVACDFNGDGKIDLGVANNNDSTISVLLGNGDGTFQPALSPVATGASPMSLTAADFNGDGKLDLVVADYIANTVSVLLGNGNGTFQAAQSFATGLNPASVAAADFNGDGKLDLAVANSTDDTVSVLLGNGNGTFQPALAPFATGVLPLSVAAGDFNGDGSLDFVVADFSSNSASLFLQAPIASVSPTSLNFGSVGVGISSGPQTVTLSNTGSGLLTIISITFQGSAFQDFSQTNPCATGVLGGKSCTISVIFTPIVAGSRSAQMVITDNYTINGAQKVSLSGTGLGPSVSLSPGSLSFGNQILGTTSAAQKVTLTNSGPGVLTITSISTNSAFAQTNTCGSSLNPGNSCTISVTFTPTTKGTYNANLTVIDNASPNLQQVSLTGSGTVIKLSPTSLNFGNQPVNTQSSPKTITMTNTGTSSVAINSITVTGTNPGDFAQTNTCGFSIAAGASCSISVTFKPKAKGSRSATVSISDFGGGSPQTVALAGTGT